MLNFEPNAGFKPEPSSRLNCLTPEPRWTDFMGDKLSNYMNQYDFEPSEGVSGARVGRLSGKWVASITLRLNPGLTDRSCEYI